MHNSNSNSTLLRRSLLEPLLVLSLAYPRCFPTMNPRELVDHIHNGPAELVLNEPLRFRRRTRSNQCDFNEFLRALQSNETIRSVLCGRRQWLAIREEDWVLLVEAIGSIKGIASLTMYPSSRGFRPFQAVAKAVNNAHSLRLLIVAVEDETFPRDLIGLIEFASSLREHTALQEFRWTDCSRLEAAQITAIDPVLQALTACPHLRRVNIMSKYASGDALKDLLHLHKNTDLCLILETDQWLAVTDEIRHGRCNVQTLTFAMIQASRSETTEAVQALASAIQLDRNLEHLELKLESGFTDEAGVALAEALTVNKTLRSIALSTFLHPNHPVRNKATFGAVAFEAFSAMLRVNTSLVLATHPPVDSATADEGLIHHHNQMVLEQRLNEVGRGRLLAASRQTSREEWVVALHGLNSNTVDDDSPDFRVSCLYSLLRLQPALCMS
jgi:hypothetical protein